MKTLKTALSSRFRLAMLRGLTRLLAWAIAPALKAAMRPAQASAARSHGAARAGNIIDGEYRRIDTRHNDRW